MHDMEIIRVIASEFVMMAVGAYLMLIGYGIGRPSKIEREIIHRALETATPNPDPIIQKRVAKLIKKFKAKSDS